MEAEFGFDSGTSLVHRDDTVTAAEFRRQIADLRADRVRPTFVVLGAVALAVNLSKVEFVTVRDV